MLVADIALFVDQVKSGPIAVVIGPPGSAIIILCNSVWYMQVFDCILKIIQLLFVAELRIVVANDYQALVGVFLMPSPQRGDHVFTIYSTECPHLEQYHLAVQFIQAQWFTGV